MKEKVLLRLVDVLFTAAKVGLNRVDIISELNKENMTPEEMYQKVSDMVDAQIERLSA